MLTELGEHLDAAGEHDAAGAALRAAVADGGPTSLDPRCLLARWCLDHGDPTEGTALLRQLWAENRRDLAVCGFVGELFEQRGELATATRRLSAGAVHAEWVGSEPSLELVRLLMSRRRVRLAQGFTEDDLDREAADMMGAALADLLADRTRSVA